LNNPKAEKSTAKPAFSLASIDSRLIYVFLILIISLLAVLVFKTNNFNIIDPVTPVAKATIDPSKVLADQQSLAPTGLKICSGNFKTHKEAEKYRRVLSERLGVPLQTIKDGISYTVQIGPEYENHSDALVVFEELSRYAVVNLSLRANS